MRLVIVSAAYLGILTGSSYGIVRACGDYFSFARKAVVNNAMYCSTTNPVALKRQAEIVTRSHYMNATSHRTESTILLLMGLGMSCLALWGSRRSPGR